MALTITTAPPAAQIQAKFAPPANAGKPASSSPRRGTTQSPAGSPAASTAQQSAALNRLLNTYRNDQLHHAPASTLNDLGRQIFAAAKAAGQRVSLPQGSPSAGAASAAAVASPPPQDARINLTA